MVPKPPRLGFFLTAHTQRKAPASLRPGRGRVIELFSVISPDASRLTQHNTTGFGAGSAASHHGATVPNQRMRSDHLADEWWRSQKGLRQTLRTEVAVGGKGSDAQLDQWAITIRYEDENRG